MKTTTDETMHQNISENKLVESAEQASALEVDSKPAQDADTNNMPEEEQCEEVDMNDKNMDPLEWSVRKTVSIPKKYYFETGNYDVSFQTKAWHRTIQAMGMILRGVENVGGFFAGILGLTNSRYDDVIAYMSEEELEQSRETAKRDKEKRRVFLKEKENQKSPINVV